MIKPHLNLKKLIPIILLADVMIALNGASVKLAAEYFSSNFLVFVRFCLNLIFLLIWIGYKRGSFRSLYQTKAWKNHAIRSLCGVGAIYAYILGVIHLPISPATLLFFSFPLFIPIVTRVWLKIEIMHRLWWGLGIAFVGLIFIIKPGSGLFNPYAIIPLFGAVLGAISGVAIRQLHYTDSPRTIMAYACSTGVVISAIVQLVQFNMADELFTLTSVVLLIFVGLFSTTFQGLYTLAARYAPSRLLSPFIYLSFFFTAIEDILILKLPMHLGLFIGFFLVLLGTIIYVLMYPKK